LSFVGLLLGFDWLPFVTVGLFAVVFACNSCFYFSRKPSEDVHEEIWWIQRGDHGTVFSSLSLSLSPLSLSLSLSLSPKLFVVAPKVRICSSKWMEGNFKAVSKF